MDETSPAQNPYLKVWFSATSSGETAPEEEQDPDLVLPRLVVLTGRNGSGKTRLLEKISLSRLQIDGATTRHALYRTGDLAQEIKYVPASRPGDYEDFERKFKSIHSVAAAQDQRWSSGERPGGRTISEDRFAMALLLSGVSRERQTGMRKRLGKDLHLATSDELWSVWPQTQDVGSPFDDAVFSAMASYQRLEAENAAQKGLSEYYGGGFHWLPPSEFRARYGERPWEVMNRALGEIGIPFVVLPPSVRTSPGEPIEVGSIQIAKIVDGGVPTPIQQPSTGERVLIRLTLSLYSHQALDAGFAWPRVLLLDEPDAFLHPSMVLQLMRLVQNLFVERLGIAVVMTTHSATTVALTPPGSLFLTRDESTIEPISTQQALNEVLQGVPSVSVEPANSRMVLVEADADEQLHSLAFTLVRPRIAGELSLSFLGLSSKNGAGGGSTRVRKLVDDLRQNGQRRVWGIVDGDGKLPPSPPVFAATERYAIENFALDPMTLGLFLGARGQEGFSVTEPETPEEWQALVDQVAESGLPEPMRHKKTRIDSALGFEIELPEVFLHKKGHELEKVLIENLVVLKKLASGGQKAGYVSNSVAAAIWRRRPELIDPALVRLYQSILDAED